jgi:hypothetical protein
MSHRSSRWIRGMAILGVVGILSILATTTRASPHAVGALPAFLVWLACLVLVVRELRPSGLLSFPATYLLLLGVFHLGLVVPLALGARPRFDEDWLHSGSMSKSLVLVALASACFALGVVTGGEDRDGRTSPGGPVVVRPLLIGGLLWAAVGAVMFWRGGDNLGVLRMSYDDYWTTIEVSDPRAFGTGLMFLVSGALVAAAGASRRVMVYLAVGLALALAPIFAKGFRGIPLAAGITFLIVWYRKSPRVATRLSLIGCALALVLVPAIRVTREAAIAPVAAPVSPVNPFEFFTEAGGSLRPLVETLQAIDSGKERLWMGRSYSLAAARVVPNVSLRWEAAPDEEASLTPDQWVSRRADDWKIGFSGVAEPYLNFGVAGVVLYFVALGFLLVRADALAGRNPYWCAVLASTQAALLWTVRNDVMALIRTAAWSAAAVLAIQAVVHVLPRLPSFPEPRKRHEGGKA